MIVHVDDLRETLGVLADIITERRMKGHVGYRRAVETVSELLDGEVGIAIDASRVASIGALSAQDHFGDPEPTPGPVAVSGEPTSKAVDGVVAYLAGETDTPPADLGPLTLPASAPALEQPAPVVEPMSHKEYKKIVLDVIQGTDHLSHSQIEDFQQCPAAWALGRSEAGVAEVPSWWSVGGTVVHDAMDRYAEHIVDRSTRTDVASDFAAELSDAARAEAAGAGIEPLGLRAAKRGAEGEDFWLTAGPDMVRAGCHLLNEALDSGWGILLNEQKMTVNGAHGFDLVAIPDLVLTRGGEIRVVDYKTGSKMPVTPAQLGRYALALFRHGTITPGQVLAEDAGVIGEFWNLRKGTIVGPFRLLPNQLELAVGAVNSVAQSLHTGNVTPSPGDHCWTCRQKPICPAMA